MNESELLYKLSQGTYTARWAHDEIIKLKRDNARLTDERDGAVNLLEGLTNGSNSRKQIIHLLGNADCFLDQLRQQAKGKDNE
jgi:hypothetical protein